MRTIIAGSRTVTNFELVLDAIQRSGINITEVVSGGAKGVDQLGERYANSKKLPLVRFIPEWDKLGKGAGYRRNELMSKYSEALIAIWDGQSRGTKHMIDIATKDGLEVFVHTCVDQ